MKKLFIALVAVAFSLSAMATSTAAARIKLVGSNATYAVNTLFLNEDDARNSLYESGYDAESMMALSNPFSVLIYAYVGDHPCEYVATNDLTGLAISFTTNMIDANYTLQFSNVSGATLTLYDRLLDQSKVISEGESYAFSVDPSLVGQQEVNDRFYLNVNSTSFHAVTTNDYGFCSFASAEAVTLPAGLKAYKGDFNIDDYSIALSYIGQVVPANEGVILWNPNESAETFYYTVGGSAPAVSGNDFVGAVAAKPVSEIVAAAIYCLHGNELQKYIGNEDIPAGKAYLPIPSGGSSAPQRIRMVFHQEEETTAVCNVEATVKAVKFVENGQIYIRRGNEVFNLQGQIVK